MTPVFSPRLLWNPQFIYASSAQRGENQSKNRLFCTCRGGIHRYYGSDVYGGIDVNWFNDGGHGKWVAAPMIKMSKSRSKAAW